MWGCVWGPYGGVQSELRARHSRLREGLGPWTIGCTLLWRPGAFQAGRQQPPNQSGQRLLVHQRRAGETKYARKGWCATATGTSHPSPTDTSPWESRGPAEPAVLPCPPGPAKPLPGWPHRVRDGEGGSERHTRTPPWSCRADMPGEGFPGRTPREAAGKALPASRGSWHPCLWLPGSVSAAAVLGSPLCVFRLLQGPTGFRAILLHELLIPSFN